jgi:hypothetical protein
LATGLWRAREYAGCHGGGQGGWDRGDVATRARRRRRRCDGDGGGREASAATPRRGEPGRGLTARLLRHKHQRLCPITNHELQPVCNLLRPLCIDFTPNCFVL